MADNDLAQLVVDTMGPGVAPRTRHVMTGLVRHLHAFAREVQLTHDEWMAGVEFVNSIGRIWSPVRNEAHRISDVLGLESLVDDMANTIIAAEGDVDPTSSSILGPFWSPHAPWRPNGSSIVQDPAPGARVCRMHGTVTDAVAGKPVAGAVVDIWQASVNGKYDFQDPERQTPNNLRGKFRTDADGRYRLYCYRPTAYSLPTDGPSYELLRLMDRHPMRPAHIHMMVTHPDFKGCTTQLYPRDDPWLATDTVFAVKPDLVVDFRPLAGDPEAELELEYHFVLSPKDYKGRQPPPPRPSL
ncbi:dioxygenase [Hirsutella rhossiliensis]